MRRWHAWSAAGLTLVLIGIVGWRFQSELIGVGARWYLGRIASAERAGATLARQRAVVDGVSRMLLLPPPPDGMVAELFDLVTQMADRTARGDIPLAWGAYIYTGYVRDLVRDRPDGRPARPPDEVRHVLDETVAFYRVGKRPDVPGITAADLLGRGGESYTRDEIEQAERDGHPLPLR